mgnify:CR=1 FL=1
MNHNNDNNKSIKHGSCEMPWWKNFALHQRGTNGAAHLIGADSDSREFERQQNEIAELAMKSKTRQDCCCRLIQIAKFWRENVLNIMLLVLSKLSVERTPQKSI